MVLPRLDVVKTLRWSPGDDMAQLARFTAYTLIGTLYINHNCCTKIVHYTLCTELLSCQDEFIDCTCSGLVGYKLSLGSESLLVMWYSLLIVDAATPALKYLAALLIPCQVRQF